MISTMRGLLVGLVIWHCTTASAAGGPPNNEPPKTGPETEKRFPPLKVPNGFKATLFACDPLIEYTSVIAAGPRPGKVFVAIDYMTGLGTEITRRSEVRLVEDTNGDGYADKATVFADGFGSIMGLAWHSGTLYVMHAPLLTALRDTNGKGVADERKDLVVGLGLTPEENPVRLHCANGVTVGHDGWLYLALGDHGCSVQRPEGDRLILEGGGILRCRPDGRDLHVFSTGLRNIYDVALDTELNVFVRDNENDGGDYKIRVCHSFCGADHGYPYLYYEQPAEALAPLADLGLGSSAGGACYLERHFPPEYRGNLFFCEWGKSLVRYPLVRAGSGFSSHNEIEFAAGAEGDPYGFKPTDVVVQRDGTLMVSDYADGQRPKRGRGRIYHIAFAGAGKPQTPPSPADPIASLDSDSYVERCDAQAAIEGEAEQGLKRLADALAAGRIGPRGRLHAIWILARLQGEKAIEPLFAIARSDPEPSVRAQAVRAIADLSDPVLARHRLDAGPGDTRLAARLAALRDDEDRRVALEIIVALARLRWSGFAYWLKDNLNKPDVALAHAAMQALRQSGNWSAVVKLLDGPEDEPLRGIALRAVSRQYDADLVDGLLERLSRETDPVRAREYAECLARVYKKPGPWVYWGYRPAPRPANEVAWERTESIAAALNRMLTVADPQLRLAVLRFMQREKVAARADALGQWLTSEVDQERVAALLTYLSDQPAADMQLHLAPVIRKTSQSTTNRLAALALFARGIDKENTGSLLALVQSLDDGPVLAEALRLLGKYPQLESASLLTGKLDSSRPEVRAAAIETLGELRATVGREAVGRLLADRDPQVRRAAAGAAGKLNDRQSIDLLLKLATKDEALVRRACLDALRQLGEPRAVPLAVAALSDRETEQTALATLRDLGGPAQSAAVAELAKRNPSLELLSAAVQTLSTWRERSGTTPHQQQELDLAVAEIQGASGNLIRWRVSRPGTSGDSLENDPAGAQVQFAVGTEGRIVLAAKGAESDLGYQAQTDIALSEPAEVELLGSGSGSMQIWLNGKSIHRREKPQPFRIDSDRTSTTLVKGTNRVVVRVGAASSQSPVEFHLRFRRKSALREHEKLLQAALARGGNLERGRAVLLDVEKSQCLKCHRLGDQGERTGPELTGLGNRFSRIYIAESILEPSRTIAPSFGTLVAALTSGKTLSGIKMAESESTLTLVDSQGQKHEIAKADIDEQTTSPLSTMPEGLEKRIAEDEFVDLIAYLASLKEDPQPDR
jgi:putative membrane-bound dehydrogenase-like protein